jgi:excisionase family DNA binding protein
MQNSIWLTIDEVAAYLKVSKETIYKLVQQNQIPASKLGNQWRFNQPTIDAWLMSRSTFAAAPEMKAANE